MAERARGERVLQTLLDALADGEPRLRLLAVAPLARVSSERAIAALAGALRGPDALVRWQALAAFRQLGPAGQAGIGSLMDVLREADFLEREGAATALQAAGPAALAALYEVRETDDVYVRTMAKELIARFWSGEDPEGTLHAWLLALAPATRGAVVASLAPAATADERLARALSALTS